MSVMLSACGSIPAPVDKAQAGQRESVSEPAEVGVAADGPGLGVIAANGNTRTQPCAKQRRTGSHLYRVGCEDPDSGSQPVRYGTWSDLGKYAMSGNVRPED